MNALDKQRKVFKMGKGDIFWQDYDRRRVCGHVGRPAPGDVFTCKMKSGKITAFEVLKVNWCDYPKNMYFADVKELGYWEIL